MNTKEAIQAMLDGKKARGKNWLSNLYICFNGTGFVNEQGAEYFEFSEADDWEIYEEPKPKQTVVIEKWLVTNGKRFDVAETSDIDVFLGDGVGWRQAKLLDTYEVTL